MTGLAVTNSVLLWVVVLLNLLLSVGLIRRLKKMSEMMSGFGDMDVGLEAGEKAPDFKAETISGESISLADFARKAVSLVFVSPECSPCVDKLPTLNALRPRAEQAGVELLLVSTGGTKEKLAELAEKYNLTLPILVAPMESNSFAEDYKAFATPSYCTLSPDGNVKEAGTFGVKWEQAFVKSWAA